MDFISKFSLCLNIKKNYLNLLREHLAGCFRCSKKNGVCRYIKKLEKKLKLKILAHKNIIHVTSSNNPRKAANAACLAAMYRLLVLELDPTRAFAPFARYGDNTFIFFLMHFVE